MRYSIGEYILYINLKLFAFLFHALPLGFALFVGRVLGRIAYWLDLKHRKIAYRNLRIALSAKFTVPQLKGILKKNYQNFGMNIIEVLRSPWVDRDYVNRYIKIKGKENLDNVFKARRGAIILSSHFGSWEMLFAFAGRTEYPFCILVDEQTTNPLLDKFLNQIRQGHGVKIFKAGKQFRQVIDALQKNWLVGMVADHGIREGIPIDFYDRRVLTSTVAMRISLRFNLPILLVYLRRVRGPEHELVFLPPLEIRRTGDLKQDVITNLETVNKIIQNYISEYPEQYLWTYRRFKYSYQRNVLILHDGKVGHLRQAQSVLDMIQEEAKKRKIEIKAKQIEVKFRSRIHSVFQALSITLSSRKNCQGCLFCLKHFLAPQAFIELQSHFADIVISCGASCAAVNYVVSSENQARSVAVMRPGALSIKRFDLVVMPSHDNPPAMPNVVKTEGALNLINEEYLKRQALALSSKIKIENELILGLMLGGDTKKFKLTLGLLKPLISQIKSFLQKHAGDILITTSRRTSPEAEELIKQEFSNYARCRLLVIANKDNIPEAVGGILGLSKIVIASPESISMISEAASAGRYVVVFSPGINIGRRHTRFLEYFVSKKYIYLTEPQTIASTLEGIIINKPAIERLEDSLLVKKAIGRLF